METDTPKIAATSLTRIIRSVGSIAVFEFIVMSLKWFRQEARYDRHEEDSPEAPEAKVGRNFIAYLSASYPAKAESLQVLDACFLQRYDWYKPLKWLPRHQQLPLWPSGRASYSYHPKDLDLESISTKHLQE